MKIILALLSVLIIFLAPGRISEPRQEAPLPKQEEAKPDERITQLAAFFEKRQCPLKPYIHDFISAADKYKIDFRILPAISVIESQCGKIYPPDTNNPFGWASARVGFESIPDAIDFVTGQLANGKYYTGKSLEQKLRAYCPNPTYPARVINLINKIN